MARAANLGMYDPPWLRAANDALWAGVAARLREAGLGDVPDGLDRDRPLGAIWRDGNLLLAQTCGYPLVTALAGAVTVAAAPRYDLPGCEGASHRSVLVVPAASPFQKLEDLRGRTAAINGRDSNTGMNLLRAMIAPLSGGRPFFRAVTETGGHLASMAEVAGGTADLAAIDCVTFGLARRHCPALVAGVRVIGETLPGPALPFVTRGGASRDEIAVLREALAAAIADPALLDATRALGLLGVEAATNEDYAVLLRYEREAASAGYPHLA